MLEGFLKRILRRKVEQEVEKKVEQAVENAFDSANKPAQPASAPAAAPAAAPVTSATEQTAGGFFAQQMAQQAAPAVDDWDTEYHHDIDYFRPIIQQNFPEYTLEENVPFATLVPGLTYYYPPYTFVMRKNGQIALVISLQSTKSYKKGLHTMCEWKAQLKHINFFIEYPDRPEYVVNRIRENLKF